MPAILKDKKQYLVSKLRSIIAQDHQVTLEELAIRLDREHNIKIERHYLSQLVRKFYAERAVRADRQTLNYALAESVSIGESFWQMQSQYTERSMKACTVRYLSLLFLLGSTLWAQLRVLPPPDLPCGESALAAQTWGSQFRFFPCHTGFNPYEVILSPADVPNLVVDWQYPTGGAIWSSPAVAAGIVYFGWEDKTVYALNADTGALIWKYTTGGIIHSSPTVANGVVYIGSFDKNVYALNAATGALLWTFATREPIESSPSVANGVMYIGSDDGNVYALVATTGAPLWAYRTGYSVFSSPAVAHNVVYVGSDDVKK
jgi:PQQ-like domain